MAQYGSTDHASMAKAGLLLGLALVLFGAGGEILGHLFFGSIPDWENTLFVFSEGTGILVAFCSVWIFGVFLPLRE